MPTSIPQLARLPIHGFILAGGKSSRMGVDKALLPFNGRPMVEIAIEKLRTFCAEVGIAGNREDLTKYAPIASESRREIGPVAGLEAGLLACSQPWAMFIPVDVPLVPAALLKNWATDMLGYEKAGLGVSLLLAQEARQPAFCLIRRDCLPKLTSAIERGERRMNTALDSIDDNDGSSWIKVENAAKYAPGYQATGPQLDHWFLNVNTPEDLALAELWALELPEKK